MGSWAARPDRRSRRCVRTGVRPITREWSAVGWGRIPHWAWLRAQAIAFLWCRFVSHDLGIGPDFGRGLPPDDRLWHDAWIKDEPRMPHHTEVHSCLLLFRCPSVRRSGTVISRGPRPLNWPRRSVWPRAPYGGSCSVDDNSDPKGSRRVVPDPPRVRGPNIRHGCPPCCCAESTPAGAPA